MPDKDRSDLDKLALDLVRIISENPTNKRFMKEWFDSILEDIKKDIETGDINEKAKPADYGKGHVNHIPSNIKGACCPVFMVKCYAKDDFEERLRGMLYHAGNTCKGINEEVYFFASKWEPHIWLKHSEEIGALRDQGVRFTFIIVTANSISEIHP